jgi:hypothetical protein
MLTSVRFFAVIVGAALLPGCADLLGFHELDASAGTEGGGGAEGGGPCVPASPGTCGLAPQCGCASNQTCDVTDVTTGAAACVEAGSAALGRGCNTTGNCVPGLTCFAGACRPYCPTANANAPCGAPGTGLCIQIVVTSTGVNAPNDTVCLVNCQLDDPTSCGGTPASGPIAGCTLSTNGGTNADCTAAGTSKTTCGGFAGGTWQAPLCAPGYGCSSTGVCNQWCRFNVSGTCSGGLTCTHVPGGDIVIDGTAYGYCS